MIQTINIQNKIKKIMLANSFIYSTPLILVIRNTEVKDKLDNARFIPDTGRNCCDTVILVDPDISYMLTGRTYPNEKYQKQQVEGTGQANYIATGYYRRAWRKGFHRGNRALVQHVKFVIWRSEDLTLLNGDDFNEVAIVSDNFHGWAPLSAGCVTVKGNMNPPTEDWKIAVNWIYMKKDTYFDACILNHSDLDASPRLRLGSSGPLVEELQAALQQFYQVKADGDFGPYTHDIVRQYQRWQGIKDDGIVDPRTASYLGLKNLFKEVA